MCCRSEEAWFAQLQEQLQEARRESRRQAEEQEARKARRRADQRSAVEVRLINERGASCLFA